jgi:FAD/FMN-containing dehydrogenase
MRPASIKEVCEIVKNTTGTISVGGGRFSMGRQTASPHSLHIDMRGMNKVLEFSASDTLIKAQTGIRWYDITVY